MTRAPNSRAISRVRSFDPESTSTISSAQRTLASVRPMLASSSIATMATESVMEPRIVSQGDQGLATGRRTRGRRVMHGSFAALDWHLASLRMTTRVGLTMKLDSAALGVGVPFFVDGHILLGRQNGLSVFL